MTLSLKHYLSWSLCWYMFCYFQEILKQLEHPILLKDERDRERQRDQSSIHIIADISEQQVSWWIQISMAVRRHLHNHRYSVSPEPHFHFRWNNWIIVMALQPYTNQCAVGQSMGSRSVQGVVRHLPALAEGEKLEARLFSWFGSLSGGKLEFRLGNYPNLITPWTVLSPAPLSC